VRAGAAELDITPRAGTQVGGSIHLRRPAELVLDNLSVKALVIENAGRTLCLVVLDVLIIVDRLVDEIRAGAAAVLGIDPVNVMVHATQTHNAPAMGDFLVGSGFPDLPEEFAWVRGNDPAYDAYAVERSVEAVRLARAAVQPVAVGAESGVEGRLAFNRRVVMRDGAAAMARGGSQIDHRSRHLEGPADPELGVVCFRTDALEISVMLVSYTCHPTNLYPRKVISADWPGVVAAELRRRFGGRCVVLVLNGACGNVGPVDPYDPHFQRDHVRMGRALADSAARVLETVTYHADVPLDARRDVLRLPIRDPAAPEVERSRAMLARLPRPQWADPEKTMVDLDWVYAAAIHDLMARRQRQPYVDYEIQTFRLGDTAFVGLPGEPFVEGQLQIKLESPTFPTYVVHNTAFAGYIPTRRAFANGGYETRTNNSSKFEIDALEQIVATAGASLRALFPQGRVPAP
jgi:hypothetical protein